MGKKKKYYVLFALVVCLALFGCENEAGKSPDVSNEKVEDKISIPKESNDKFAYRQLDDEGKQIYDELYYTIKNHEEEIEVSSLDEEKVDTAFDYVLKDHPEIFWCDSYKCVRYMAAGKTVSLEVEPIYSMTIEEAGELEKQIELEVQGYIDGINGNMDGYEKAKFIYTKMIEDINYNTASENNQNIISAFINKETVCQGFAKAFQYLMYKLDIECTLVRGKANGDSHVWNLIKLDDEYYYVDVTWGSTNFEDDEYNEKYVNYNYFCITTEEICKNHEITETMEVPECVSITNNYFVREGRYFTEFDIDKIGTVITQAIQNNEVEIALKASTEEVFKEITNYLIDERHIFDYYSTNSSISFSKSKFYNALIIFFE